MAIIYTYPQINSSSDLAASDLMIISDMSANGKPTKSLTLKNLADFVTSTGTGTGTTNKIIKWSDGPSGLLGDSIMTENATQIDLAGTFLSTSSPTVTQAAPVSGIKSVLAATASAPHVALYGDSKHTGATQANSNYGVYAKGEFEGTSGFTSFIIGGNLEARYDGSGANGANASMYGAYNLARATSVANGTVSYMIGANTQAKVESANVTATNLQGQHTSVELTNGTAGDVIVNLLDFDGTGGTVTNDFSYLQIQNDTMPTVNGTARAINSKSVLPSLFQGQVEIPLVPTINAHATSKQYVDQQIASIPAGLVFQGNWNASTNTPALASGTGTVGNYYVVSVAGNTNLDGITDWEVGDWAVFVEVGGVDKWDKIDQTFVQGAGATGQVSFWNGINSVTGDNDLYWDNANKRLGIGTTSPNTTLELGTSGVVDTDFQMQSDQAGKYFKIASAGNFTELKSVGDQNLFLNSSGSGGYLSFLAGNSERMRINYNGKVGIGTTSPSRLLQVKDTSGVASIAITSANTGTAQLELGGTSDNDIAGISYNGSTQKLFLKTNNTAQFDIDSSGDASFSGNVSLVDNKKIYIGSSNDLEIYHNATDSAIQNNTGDLYISNFQDDGDVIFRSDNGSGGHTQYFRIDGGYSSPQTIFPDNSQLNFGNGLDLRIVHDSGVNKINSVNGELRIIQNQADSDIKFFADDGSGGGTTEYFRVDGGASTVAFSQTITQADSKYIGLGNSFDFHLQHNGTNSVITNSTGNLEIRQNADDADIIFYSDDGSGGTTEYFRVDGGSEISLFSKNVRFPNGIYSMFGSSNQLLIFHDGTDAQIFNTGIGGDLVIRNDHNDKDIRFLCDDGSGGTTEYFRLDGQFEIVSISKNFFWADNVKATFGNASDLKIYHDGTDSYVSDTGTGDLIIQGSNDIWIKEGTDNLARFNGQGVKLYYLNVSKLETISSGAKLPGPGDGITLVSPDGNTTRKISIDNSGNLVVA